MAEPGTRAVPGTLCGGATRESRHSGLQKGSYSVALGAPGRRAGGWLTIGHPVPRSARDLAPASAPPRCLGGPRLKIYTAQPISAVGW